MKYAVIEASGAQHKVTEGESFTLEKLDGEKGENIEFDKVLLIVDENEVKVGAPYVEKARVKAVIEEQFKDKKLYVYKYKPKVRYRRKTGHRQLKTKVSVKKIQA